MTPDERLAELLERVKSAAAGMALEAGSGRSDEAPELELYATLDEITALFREVRKNLKSAPSK